MARGNHQITCLFSSQLIKYHSWIPEASHTLKLKSLMQHIYFQVTSWSSAHASPEKHSHPRVTAGKGGGRLPARGWACGGGGRADRPEHPCTGTIRPDVSPSLCLRTKAVGDLPWGQTASEEPGWGWEGFVAPQTTVSSTAPEAPSPCTDGLVYEPNQPGWGSGSHPPPSSAVTAPPDPSTRSERPIPDLSLKLSTRRHSFLA